MPRLFSVGEQVMTRSNQLYVLFVLQSALCVVSFLYPATIGGFVATGRFSTPTTYIGFAWLAVTFGVVGKSTQKPGAIFLSVIEIPFAFSWPAWMCLYAFLGSP
jgi:hypothetical protein